MSDEQAVSSSTSAPDRLPEIGRVSQTVAGGKHIRPRASDCEAVATLTATGGQDGATRTGAHPQTEAVLLVPATVVRLVRTLAHEYLHALCRGSLDQGRVQDRVARQRSRQSPCRTTGTAHPREGPELRPGRGHAAPVEPISTCQRYVPNPRTVNSPLNSTTNGQRKGTIVHLADAKISATRRTEV